MTLRLYIILRRIWLTVIAWFTTLVLWAQDDQDADFDLPSVGRGLSIDEEFDEEMMPIGIGRYTNELIYIALLAIVIYIVRRMVRKRNRNGCTFWIVFTVAAYYIMTRFVLR